MQLNLILHIKHKIGLILYSQSIIKVIIAILISIDYCNPFELIIK